MSGVLSPADCLPLTEERWCFEGRPLSMMASKGEVLRLARGDAFAPFIVTVWGTDRSGGDEVCGFAFVGPEGDTGCSAAPWAATAAAVGELGVGAGDEGELAAPRQVAYCWARRAGDASAVEGQWVACEKGLWAGELVVASLLSLAMATLRSDDVRSSCSRIQGFVSALRCLSSPRLTSQHERHFAPRYRNLKLRKTQVEEGAGETVETVITGTQIFRGRRELRGEPSRCRPHSG